MNYALIISSIRKGRCLLVVGPELAPAPKGLPLGQAFRQYAPQLHAPEVLIYDSEGLLTLAPNMAAKYGQGWEQFCAAQPLAEVYTRLTEIPFSLVFSLATDGLLERAYGTRAKLFTMGLAKIQAGREMPTPTKEMPVVVSLLGNVGDSLRNIVFTHGQIYEFLFRLLENGKEKALPEAIQQTVAEAEHIVFIGCKVQQWYMQVMMRLLGLKPEDSFVEPFATDQPALPADEKAYLKAEFRLDFADTDAHAVVETLWRAFNEASAETNLHPVRTAANAAVARGEYREALKALVEHFREDTATMTDLTLLRGRLSTLQEDIADGIISTENATLERNRIARAILDLAQMIE